ncbi:hypothetical protein HELRODRAFT_180154 [Helobdella robusta]|uniref:Uncharacterized protein n=1 Tax=Helobdella robusta TaxID=6412 RepID=T1FFJ1_HELRO|nr:hypothetical protein HELRODRAFT_180154 [Helobdella robusta]ESN94808.1 hypothetical protein HELRODRAFT_180154 [Helobdella robusta]
MEDSTESNVDENPIIPLIGYHVKERYVELKDSYEIKSKNFEKLFLFKFQRKVDDGAIKKLLDDVVLVLKSENKKLKLMMRYISNKSSHTYLTLFPDRESKLKYSRKSPEDMMESLTCKIGLKKNALNLLTYRFRKMTELSGELDKEIVFLDRLKSSEKLEDKVEDEINKLKHEISDLENKAQVNAYIKSNYIPIIRLLQEEVHLYPSKMRDVELALKHNKKELDDITSMHQQAKESRLLAFKQLKQLQENLVKDRKGRGEAVLHVRKNMAQRFEIFEKMKKKKMSVDGCNDDKNEYRQNLNLMRLARFRINDLFGGIKSTLLETRILHACQTMITNDERNEFQNDRKEKLDIKFKDMQLQIKQAQIAKVKMVQLTSNKREKFRQATREMEAKIVSLEKEIIEKKKKLTIDGNLLMGVKKGVYAVASKLSWIPPKMAMRSDVTIEQQITEINEKLAKLIELQQEMTADVDVPLTRQEFCLSNLLAKSIDKRYSEDDQTHQNDMASTLEDVLEINDNTPAVRNHMKAASKRLVMKQKIKP